MKKIVLIVLSIVTVCSYASKADNEYLNSRNGANLVVPAPLTSSNLSHFYDLPREEKNAQVSIAPPAPPATDRQTT